MQKSQLGKYFLTSTITRFQFTIKSPSVVVIFPMVICVFFLGIL